MRQQTHVVVLAQMSQNEVSGSAHRQRWQCGRAVIVGEVSAVRADAPFEVIGIVGGQNHPLVIVGFQHHYLTAAQSLVHFRCVASQVGGNPHLVSVIQRDAVAQTAHAVVAGMEGLHPPHRKALQRSLLELDSLRQLDILAQIVQHSRRAKQRNRIFFQKDRQPLDVVRMFVGDEDSLELLNIGVQGLERIDRRPTADAQID